MLWILLHYYTLNRYCICKATLFFYSLVCDKTHTHTPSLGCLHETACIGINSIFGSLSWFFLLCLSSAEPLPAANFDTYRLRSCTTTTVKEQNCTALLACYSFPHFLESLAPLRVILNSPCHAQRGFWPHSPDRQTLVTEGWFAAGDLLQTKEKQVLTNCCIIFFLSIASFGFSSSHRCQGTNTKRVLSSL